MTWKKTMGLILFTMLSVWLIVGYVITRQRIQVQTREIMGVRSLFPVGNYSRVKDAKNGWQGYGFAGSFRLFSRPSPLAAADFQKLVEDNFSRSPLQQGLSLFGGGFYALQRVRKGYRMACLFFHGNTNYWADMVSTNSLHFSRQVFTDFILNLEIDGKKASPAVAEQLLALHERTSPFLVQTPLQLLAMIAAIFALVLFIITAVNVFSGSRPRRLDAPAQACTPWATVLVRGFGRRQINACCVCLEGESLVVYRFRRPLLKIDMRNERQHVVWKKRSLYYKNYRVLLTEDDFQNWRSRFF